MRSFREALGPSRLTANVDVIDYWWGSTPALVIREYEPADHKTLVELNRYGLAAAGVPEDTDIYGGDLDDIAGTYVIGRGAMGVGDIQGAAVAMSGLREIDTSRCKILRTRVNPNYQGRGSPALSLGVIGPDGGQ